MKQIPEEMTVKGMNEENQLIGILLDFGEAMLGAGGEINRVEDSISRLGTAYGAVMTSVFIIPSSIELTIAFPDGETFTRTRRIRSGGATNFHKLGKLNSLSRRCAMERLPVEELKKELEEIKKRQVSRTRIYVGSILAGSAFSLFFGGGPLDAVFAGLVSALVAFMEIHLAPLCPNKVFYLFCSSLLMGVVACLMDTVFPGINIDKLLIGVIMLLVPGIAITTATRDALIGDTISGITKLADSLVWAAALAAGVMIAISVFVR